MAARLQRRLKALRKAAVAAADERACRLAATSGLSSQAGALSLRGHLDTALHAALAEASPHHSSMPVSSRTAPKGVACRIEVAGLVHEVTLLPCGGAKNVSARSSQVGCVRGDSASKKLSFSEDCNLLQVHLFCDSSTFSLLRNGGWAYTVVVIERSSFVEDELQQESARRCTFSLALDGPWSRNDAEWDSRVASSASSETNSDIRPRLWAWEALIPLPSWSEGNVAGLRFSFGLAFTPIQPVEAPLSGPLAERGVFGIASHRAQEWGRSSALGLDASAAALMLGEFECDHWALAPIPPPGLAAEPSLAGLRRATAALRAALAVGRSKGGAKDFAMGPLEVRLAGGLLTGSQCSDETVGLDEGAVVHRVVQRVAVQRVRPSMDPAPGGADSRVASPESVVDEEPLESILRAVVSSLGPGGPGGPSAHWYGGASRGNSRIGSTFGKRPLCACIRLGARDVVILYASWPTDDSGTAVTAAGTQNVVVVEISALCSSASSATLLHGALVKSLGVASTAAPHREAQAAAVKFERAMRSDLTTRLDDLRRRLRENSVLHRRADTAVVPPSVALSAIDETSEGIPMQRIADELLAVHRVLRETTGRHAHVELKVHC